MATEIEALLEYGLNIGASEVIISEGGTSAVRLAGKVCTIPDAPSIEPGTIAGFLGHLDGESGSMIGGPWVNSRWRVRYFREARGNSGVFRPILDQCPDFSMLGVPETMNNLLGLSSGLIVFGGPACSGKTTTASAYVRTLCSCKMLRTSIINDQEEIPIDGGESLILKDSTGSVAEKMDQVAETMRGAFATTVAEVKNAFVESQNATIESMRKMSAELSSNFANTASALNAIVAGVFVERKCCG